MGTAVSGATAVNAKVKINKKGKLTMKVTPHKPLPKALPDAAKVYITLMMAQSVIEAQLSDVEKKLPGTINVASLRNSAKEAIFNPETVLQKLRDAIRGPADPLNPAP